MDPHRDLESRAFAGNWRVYQQQALDAFDADVAAGDNRAYLVRGSHARCMLLWLSSSVATLTFPGLRRLVAAWQRPVSWLDNVFFVVLWPAD